MKKNTWRLLLWAGLVLSSLNLQAQTLRTATATATTSFGFVVNVTVNDGGAGYTFPPNVTFSGVGTGAAAYSVISNGVVTQIVITSNGSGYSSVPGVVIAAPSVGHYSFHSGAAYITVPDSASLDSTTDQLTIECWFNRSSNLGSWNAMISKEDASTGLTGYFFGNDGNNVTPILYTSPTIYDGSFTLRNSNPTYPAWHHLAVQYDGLTYTAWLDGKALYSTNVVGQIILGNNPLSIGCQNSGFRAFDGYLAEVRISKSIRYTNTFNPSRRFIPDQDTVALYHFDEGAGTVVYDSSVNGNNGLVTGSSAWSTNVPVFSPATVNLRKAVYVDFSNLIIGTNYQLQISTNLHGGTWSNVGAPFTATNQSMNFSNYWSVSDWNQLYFKLSQ